MTYADQWHDSYWSTSLDPKTRAALNALRPHVDQRGVIDCDPIEVIGEYVDDAPAHQLLDNALSTPYLDEMGGSYHAVTPGSGDETSAALLESSPTMSI